MFRVLGTVLSAVVLVGYSPAARADDAPKDVLEKAIKAHGGAELLTKNQAGQLRAKGKIVLPGAGEVDFSQEASYMLPDKFKESVEISVGGQTIRILTIANGDKISIDALGNSVEITDAIKSSMKDAQQMLKVGRLVGLAGEKGYELNAAGEVKVNDKPAVGVRVSAKNQKDITLFFDKATHLLAKMEYRTTEPMSGTEFNEERILGDYKKDADGNMVPHKVTILRDGKKYLDAEVSEGKYLEKLPDSEFKK